MAYRNLGDTQWLIVKAGIHAEMVRRGWDGTVETGYRLAGKFVEPLGPEGGDIGGRMREGLPTGPEVVDSPFDPREEIYRWWVDNVWATFYSWGALPDPAWMDGSLGALGAAADRLACRVALNDTELTGGNQVLDGEIRTMLTELAGFNGKAVNTFSRYYANRLPPLVAAHFAATGLAAVLLAGQQETWKRAREDVSAIADSTLAAVAATTPTGGEGPVGASPTMIISVVGALVGIAATIASGGAALPLSLSLASSGVGVLTTLFPATEPNAETTRLLAAGEPRTVLTHTRAALSEVNRLITAHDQTIASSARDATGLVASYADFDIATPALLDATDIDDILLPSEIREDLPTLKEIGNDVMPEVAGELGKSSTLAEPGFSDAGWQRDAAIGIGGVGAHPELVGLLRAVETSLDEAGREILAAGKHLVIAASLMEKTEEEVEQSLADHARKVDTAGLD